MTAFETAQAALADARDLDSVMAAGWDAFELTYFVAHRYGGLKSDGFATWMYAMEPASDGADALDPGPVRRQARLSIDSADLADLSEDDAFRTLAALAALLQDRLSKAALTPPSHRLQDAKSCSQAAEAAAQLYDLFVLDE